MSDIKMECGQQYKNYANDIHEIVKISPTATIVHAKNINTSEVIRFRFYEASGYYIDSAKGGTTELGILIQ